MPPSKVLLATRLPTDSDPVAAAARRLATGLRAELLLVYVASELETVPHLHAATGEDHDALRERILDAARAEVDAYVRRNFQDTEVRVLIEDGDVAEAVVRVAAEEAVDYLVIGTEGHSALRELILGGTSKALLRRAPCPVVVVPPGKL